jgi:hypothetical protein
MSDVELFLSGKIFQVPGLVLRQTCRAFAMGPLPVQYTVTSRVSAEIFQTFVCALKGETIEITKANFSGLSALCDEFGLDLKSPSYRLAEIETVVEHLRTDIGRLFDEVNALRGVAAITERLSDEITQIRASLSILTRISPSPGCLDSEIIISDFPEIFAEFQGKRFKILWRGSRDGFKAQEFHRRCDGHKNTLTVILDTKGNIFGGFTPVEWESKGYFKSDDSLKSFLFTLKNPHNVMARKFALKAKEKHRAIYCDSKRGPCFCDIGVSDNCNTNFKSFTGINANTTSFTSRFGDTYINDTGMDRNTFFTGEEYFMVKEVEVFEVTE